MRYYILILVTFFCFGPAKLFAQQEEERLLDKELINPDQSDDILHEKLDLKPVKPLNFNLFTGTSFFYSGRFGAGNSIYIGSNAAFVLSPRLTLEVGTSINFTRLTDLPAGFFPENDMMGIPASNYTGITMYTRGSYYFSDRLKMNAIAFKQYSPKKYPVINPLFTNYNNEGMSVELNYRLFRNMNIGAQFSFIRNDNPYLPSRLSYPDMNNNTW